jgi:hypothetical protein
VFLFRCINRRVHVQIAGLQAGGGLSVGLRRPVRAAASTHHVLPHVGGKELGVVLLGLVGVVDGQLLGWGMMWWDA